MATKVNQKEKIEDALANVKTGAENSNSVPDLKAEVARLSDLVLELKRSIDD